ncbi:helix-turn-helix transcriptional regulator [Chitinimonas sp.]|uniref:helix-turn-helix transcriptional regulator n=1 Tax=Chitinimonas sp. TaxID=1934313 RepID=UPI0035AF90A9
MPNPTTRVLALLELLQTHGLLSGSELARRLEVDPRTLRRYVVMLEQLGIPVVAERGRDGGYRLMHGFKLPPMLFSNEEALAVALGLVASRQLGLNDAAPAGASALAKLERVMPEGLRKQVRAVGETVTLDLARASRAGDPQILATLSTAARAQQRVQLRYGAADGQASERAIDPYGLAYLHGAWYVVAYCHLRQGLRVFRLDRIVSARPMPASFARPADFDPLGHISEAIAIIPRLYQAQVRLALDLPAARQQVPTWLGVLRSVGDSTVLQIEADDLDWVARELARLPCDFTILSPEGLHTAIRRQAQRLLAACADQ